METVVKCQKVKEWNGKPIYEVELSNGAGGQSFNVDIPIGTPENELTFTPNGSYPDKIVWNNPNKQKSGFNKGGNRGGNESFALSYAKDIAIAKITKGQDIKASDIIMVAEEFYKWMETKKK